MNARPNQVIQWYPGHMAAAMRKITERMQLVDLVVEIVDARLPLIGANPRLDSLIANRPRLLVLSREDLADPVSTVKWLKYFAGLHRAAVAIDAREQSSFTPVRRSLEQLRQGEKGTRRAIVLGLPNAGKSAVINGLIGRAAAKTENRAGVTRGTQWFRIGPELEVMDTPGILVPRIESPQAQWMLAITGAIPRQRYDPQDVVERFGGWLQEELEGRASVPDLTTFAHGRGFLTRGNIADLHNAATSYIKDFNDGKFGRMTFELPPNELQTTKS